MTDKTYRIFDEMMQSSIPLPELLACPGEEPAITFRLKAGGFSGEGGLKWIHEWKTAAGEVTLAVAREGQAYLLRFPGGADFRVSEDGRDIVGYAFPGRTKDTIRHLLLDQVVPRVMGHQGRLVLHGGAVILPGGQAVAFLGNTGWGKSTLVASFYRNGATLITDDCLLLESRDGGVVGIPAYPGLRLLDDSRQAVFGAEGEFVAVTHHTYKHRLKVKGIDHAGVVGLAAIFVLSAPDQSTDLKAPVIERLEGAQAMMAIIGSSFLIDVRDEGILRRNFIQAGQYLSHGVPVFTLTYPREHGRLGEVRKMVQKRILRAQAVQEYIETENR